MEFQNILLVGCGNMAGAMLRGWLSAGLEPQRFTVADPAARDLPDGVRKLDAAPSTGDFDAILLGIKPQILDNVAPAVEPLAGPGTVLISLLAGVELSVLRSCFPRTGGIVRLMPNLAAALGKSPMALESAGMDEKTRGDVFSLLKPLGAPEWVAEEEFDLVTALAGSGPAFVYRFIDALAAGATELGLPEDKAKRLALAMVDGAGALAATSECDPGELARRVASPGGVTQAGLDAIDEGASLNRLILKTLRAARDRSAEMAAEARDRG